MNEELILKYVLANAVKYKGKADVKAIMGKILQERPDLKPELSRIASYASVIVRDVNTMTLKQQKEKLQELAPELLEVKHEKQKRTIPDLQNVHGNKIVMRFAPNPNGPLSLGHCRQALWNWFFVEKYKGKYILRFDDTDAKIKTPLKEAYDWFKEDLYWLGVHPHETVIQSKRFTAYYWHAEQLLEQGYAYVCLCDLESFRKLRDQQKSCPCRNLPPREQLLRWQSMFSDYKEGEVVMRIKTNLLHRNPAVRDWPAFRIIEKSKHPLDKKTKVWPLLNFASAIDDHEFGVTHILRGTDLKISDDRQKYVYEYFGWQYPETMYSGKLLFSGIKSTSEARKLIEQKKLSGWDDPRLGTVKALRKRGFQKEALIHFIKDVGITPADTKVSFERLVAYNKEIVDPRANRYFAVFQPKKVLIKNCPKMTALLPLHPQDKKRGTRKVKVTGEFYVQDALEKNKHYRFMHLFNFKDKMFVSEDIDPSLKASMIHWLSITHDLVHIEVLMDDGTWKEGLAEPAVKNVNVHEIIQFERNFFVRCEEKLKTKIKFVFAHT